MSTSTHEPEGMRIQANTHEPEDMRMQGCEDIHMNLRIQESIEVRLKESTLENTFLAYIYLIHYGVYCIIFYIPKYIINTHSLHLYSGV